MQHEMSFNDFAGKIGKLYSENNNNKDFEEIYSYLCRNTAYLSRAILRQGDTTSFFVKSFSWLFALSQKLEIDLETSFRQKFPDVCPYCIIAPCRCADTHKRPYRDMPLDAVRGELKEKYNTDFNRSSEITLDDAVRRIAKIYPSNKSIWSAFGSFYHFSRVFEELGEVHEAYSSFQKNGSKVNLEEELADVAAWLFSAWEIHIYPRRLSHAISDYYLNNCPVCKCAPCQCKKYSDRTQMLTNPQSLQDFKERLAELIALQPEFQTEIEELLGSVDTVLKNASTKETKQTLIKSRSVFEKIEAATQSTSKITENTSKTAEALKKIFACYESFKFMLS